MRHCALIFFALLAAMGLQPVVATEGASLKGGAMQALPGETGGEMHVAHLQKVAVQLEKLSRKALPTEGGKETKEWGRHYNRWLRINSARMKELAMRWNSRLKRAAGHSRQVADTNTSFKLQSRQMAIQMLNENHQFGENCVPLLPRTETVSLLLTPLQDAP